MICEDLPQEVLLGQKGMQMPVAVGREEAIQLSTFSITLNIKNVIDNLAKGAESFQAQLEEASIRTTNLGEELEGRDATIEPVI